MCDDRRDPQHEISQDAYERLSSATDARGRKIEVVKIIYPTPTYLTEYEVDGVEHVEGSQPREAGERLAASYVNCYITNSAVLVPTFGRTDEGRRQSPETDRNAVSGSEDCRHPVSGNFVGRREYPLHYDATTGSRKRYKFKH
jgi:hypothetical protein